MRIIGKIIVPALAIALQNPENNTQYQIFTQVVHCTKSLVSWALMAQYPSNPDKTLEYMDQYLSELHMQKDVSLKYWKGKVAEMLANQICQTLQDEDDTQIRFVQVLTITKKC